MLICLHILNYLLEKQQQIIHFALYTTIWLTRGMLFGLSFRMLFQMTFPEMRYLHTIR